MGVEVGRAIWQEGFSAVGRASPVFFSVKVPVVESQHQARRPLEKRVPQTAITLSSASSETV